MQEGNQEFEVTLGYIVNSRLGGSVTVRPSHWAGKLAQWLRAGWASGVTWGILAPM